MYNVTELGNNIMNTQEFLSVEEAAAELGVTARRVRQICEQGLLGQRIGSVWAISRRELNEFKQIERKPGRPKGS
jgi:excisionase family DNA binding protein